MEKNYFLDRHPLVNEHNSIFPGDEVFICLKNMQPYAKELQDLTKITVSSYLTSQTYHPRGQKVKGIETVWDDINKEYINEERVGRITYKIIDGYVVPTKEGFKYIQKYGKNKLKLSTFDEIKNKFLLIAVFKFETFKFKVIFDNWLYFNSVEEVKDFISRQNISNIKLHMDRISLINNERPFIYKNIEIFYNNKKLKTNIKEFFELLVQNYESSNNSIYNFNKNFNLELECFELKSPEKRQEGEI